VFETVESSITGGLSAWPDCATA